jgi:hypothetical protein
MSLLMSQSLSRISTTSLLAAAVVAALALSACGDKKEVYAAGPRASESSPAPKKTETTSSDPTAGNGPATPVADVATGAPSGVSGGGAPKEAEPAKSLIAPDVHAEPTYTVAESDQLVSFLAAHFADPRQTAEAQQRDAGLAKGVIAAKLFRDAKTAEVRISLRMKEETGAKTYILKGLTAGGFETSELKVVAAAGPGLLTTGKRPVRATVQCLDKNGDCENALVNFTVGAGQSEASAAVVFRKSIADVHFTWLEETSTNADFLTWYQLVESSKNNAKGGVKISEAIVKSFEVVDGRSGFEAMIRTTNDELVEFAGPLLAATAEVPLNVPLVLTSGMKESIALDELSGYGTALAQTVSSASLVENNGKGALTIAVKLRKSADLPQEGFKISFARNLNAVAPLSKVVALPAGTAGAVVGTGQRLGANPAAK